MTGILNYMKQLNNSQINHGRNIITNNNMPIIVVQNMVDVYESYEILMDDMSISQSRGYEHPNKDKYKITRNAYIKLIAPKGRW